jgi:hypothetical protein
MFSRVSHKFYLFATNSTSIDADFQCQQNGFIFTKNGQELVKLQGEYYFTSNPLIYFTTLSPISHKYLVLYDRYFKSKLNESIIESFEWELNLQFREHCATSAKTMFSQYHTNSNNFYINRCGFSMPTKRFYFHWKRVETSDDMNLLNLLNLFIFRNFRSTKTRGTLFSEKSVLLMKYNFIR